jgi:choline dehydrogenase-like flavoprotein
MILQQREEFDAIVVGSGIAGGWAAKELTERGLRTLVLERGTEYEHRTDYVTEHKRNWEFPLRDRRLPPEVAGSDFPVQSRTSQFRESTKHVFISDRAHPYEEEAPFTWIQGGRVGGRSTMWGRQVYRWSDLDFEANLKDGHGVDWPIRYADLAPWYAHVERFIGVSGQPERLPQLPDGEFQAPMAMNAGEKVLKASVERAFPERRVTIGRAAVLTEPIGDRAPCHYCGPCMRGCSTGSYFSSQASTLPAARKTGRLTLRPNALVHSVLHDPATNRATGVRYLDARTRETHDVFARVVFLAASTLGSTRILLNSTSARFPTGLANSSGELGHNLMDHHFQVGARGELEGHLDRYYQGNRPNGIYVPRFRNLRDPGSDRLGFVRGFGYQGGASRRDWTRGSTEEGVGVELKRRLRDPGSWTINLGAWGEHLPRRENYALLSEKKDEWGLPVLRIRAVYGDNERAMRADARAQAEAMLQAAGCTNVVGRDALTADGYGAEPGLCIHEMGTARMGRDPRTSVLNAYNQAHDVPNLFVTDGACMTSSSCVNPSLTYMALTARAVDHAVGLMKQRTL